MQIQMNTNQIINGSAPPILHVSPSADDSSSTSSHIQNPLPNQLDAGNIVKSESEQNQEQ